MCALRSVPYYSLTRCCYGDRNQATKKRPRECTRTAQQRLGVSYRQEKHVGEQVLGGETGPSASISNKPMKPGGTL
ncbi:hypothetical protein MHYP_G00330920 [Metynnis hypsauchen]